jgi:hypothetical protein
LKALVLKKVGAQVNNGYPILLAKAQKTKSKPKSNVLLTK